MTRTAVPVLLSGFCQALIVASALASSVPAPAGPSKGQQRCDALQAQFEAAIESHPDAAAKRAEAEAAADKGEGLCAAGKPALGLRYYVKALRLIGVQPNLPKQ
ncbi:MAG: hypothetical protein HY245_14415 [Rhizobiales bacterium]|nr:hypothetical protein [Hyphomicrobiales bacterium]MBI3674586.1 hypothetical protein [Hyphomicrobiales bacterium]